MNRLIITIILALFITRGHDASAFWGGNATDANSGLDVAAGFDVNTITTVTGTIMTPPERKGQGQHSALTVAAPQGTVTIVLGPSWYWEKQTITLAKSQELAITGSLAQGKDGALYLFAQRLENRSNGETITLRSESGTPAWSRNGAGNQNGLRGTGYRGGSMRGGRR